MALPIWQRTITTESGDVIPGAEITVVNEATGLNADIFSNRTGTTPRTNPFFTGADGFAQFYAAPGEYRIEATGPTGSIVWRWNVLTGDAATRDVTTSDTDTDTSRVMRPGNGGFLTGSVSALDESGADGVTFTRFDGVQNIYNLPSFGNLMTWIRGSNRGCQLYASSGADETENRWFIRTIGEGGWGEFKELYHTGNLGESDTAWTTVTSLDNGWTGTLRYIKRGGMVTVNIDQIDGSSATDESVLIIPLAYRPSFTIYAVSRRDGTTDMRWFRVLSGGSITCDAGDPNVRGSVTYPVLP